jgi:branched-chain amino acid transport system substrate-binding protein
LNAPLTGSFAYYGTETKNALELYFNKNKILLENKGIVLDYSFQDNTGSVKESLNNAKLFLSEDNLDILVSTNTPLSQPIIPLAEESKVNLLALVTGAKDFALGNKYVFRDAILSYNSGEFLANYLLTNNKKRVATLVVNDDYGLSTVNGLKNRIENLGGTVVLSDKFESNTMDFKTQIYKIKDKNPDAILFVGRENDIIICIKQMYEAGIDLEKVFSINSYESPTVLEGLLDLASKVRFVSVYYDIRNKDTIDFFKEYKEVYEREPGIYALDAYSAAQYILYCSLKYSPTSESLNYCLNSEKFKTVKGNIYYDNKHDVVFNYALYKYNNSKDKIMIYN